ncbi:MAG: transporter substrate-binding domain-containing protein [Salinisphaeraceae bacterium]|nr:transporter substrate-binding domain-containing protein [Salinisphaeraceae bacterium]
MPALILVLSLLCSLAHAQPTVRFANGEWLPYQGEQLPQHGFITQLVKEAFASQGVSVKYDFLPWKRGYELARKGEYHGTFMWRYSEERAEDFYFSAPIIDNRTVMFHRKELDFEWHSNDALVGYLIGGTLGYDYGFNDHPGVDIDWVESDKVNFKKLIHGRIDLFALDERVGYHILNSEFTAKKASMITHSVGPEEAIEYHVLISRSKPNAHLLLEILNAGLSTLRASGRYAEIVEGGASYQKAESGNENKGMLQ